MRITHLAQEAADKARNDFKENPNGEGYISRISEAGSSDLLAWSSDRREAFRSLIADWQSRPEIIAAAAQAQAQTAALGTAGGTTTFYQGRAPLTGGQRELPLGRDGDGAAVLPTDPEGRELAAKFIAGVRNPGGPNVGLSDKIAAARSLLQGMK